MITSQYELDYLVDWVDKEIRKVCEGTDSICLSLDPRYTTKTVDEVIFILERSGYNVRKFESGDYVSLNIKW